jgi:hypothetical protein
MASEADFEALGLLDGLNGDAVGESGAVGFYPVGARQLKGVSGEITLFNVRRAIP